MNPPVPANPQPISQVEYPPHSAGGAYAYWAIIAALIFAAGILLILTANPHHSRAQATPVRDDPHADAVTAAFRAGYAAAIERETCANGATPRLSHPLGQ